MTQSRSILARRRTRILWAAIALIGAASPALADTWTNASGNGTWSTPMNWLDGTPPTAAELALFPSPGPANDVVTLTSPTPVNALQFDDNYTIDGSSLLTVQGANSGVSVAAAQTATINTPMSFSNLEKNGAGTLALGGSNTVIGYININAGALRVSSDANLSTGNISAIKLYSTLEVAGSFSTSKYINQLGGNFRVLAGNTLTLTGNGQLDSGSSPVIKDGDGTLVLAGHNSRSGTTTVNGGTLRLEQVGQPGYGNITVGAGALEIVNKSFTNATLGAASTFRASGASTATNITFAGGVDVFATIATVNSTDTFAITFTGTAATPGSLITISGPGTVTPHVNGANTYVGNWQVNGGTMRLFGNSYLGPNPSAIAVNNGGTALWDSTFFNKPVNLNDGGAVRGKGFNSQPGIITVAASANVTIGTASLSTDLLTISGTNRLIGGAGANVTVDGAGSVRVSGSNTYSGGWTVNSGTLRLSGPGTPLGSGISPILMSGGALEISAVNLLRDVTFNAGVIRGSADGNVTGGVVTVAPGANVSLAAASSGSLLTVGDGANDLTGGDASTYVHINGNGGRVLLAQPSNLACNWLIDSGILQVSADAQLGGAANTLALNSQGTLRTGATANYARDLSAQGGTIDSGTFDMGLQNVGGSGFTKIGTGALQIDQLGATTVNITSGVVKINHDGTSAATSKLNSLTVNAAAKLDLTNNALVMVNQAAGSWDGAQYTGIIGLVAKGRDGGTWDGAGGIITSESDAANGLTALVAMRASDAGYDAPATFRGLSITPNDTLVAYTWGGDANLDGELTGDDYFAIDSNITQSGFVFGYNKGDFNYDGEVNGDDYFIIDSNIVYAQNSPPFPMGAGIGDLAAVPEPALSLVAPLAILLCRRRR